MIFESDLSGRRGGGLILIRRTLITLVDQCTDDTLRSQI
jgi:hypothetical protein